MRGRWVECRVASGVSGASRVGNEFGWSHPSGKNKDAARVGHPELKLEFELGTGGRAVNGSRL